MSRTNINILIEPADLRARLGDDRLLVLDLCKSESYTESHVPGSVWLEYKSLLDGRSPALGRLPDIDRLSGLAAKLGLEADRPVVAYDDDGGGKAGRLLWTLHMIGHTGTNVLNGGIHAWRNEGYPLSREPVATPPVPTDVTIYEGARATRDYVLQRLGDPGIGLLDARSPEEFAGTKIRALRGGHIPGATNLNWLDTIDMDRNARLKPDDVLDRMLRQNRLTSDKEIIVYCQTHHRSAHSYMMLKHLGYPQVRAYDGSWSEWGNDTTLPIE